MGKKLLEYLKESGVYGNLVAAVIIWLIGLFVALLSNISALKYTMAFSVPLFVLIGSILILLGIEYFIYKIISNPIRQYGNIFGYYRKLYHSSYYPYLKNGDRYYTKVNKIVEYRVYRDGITKIEPFEFYAYKPRGPNGEELLHNISVTTLLNGHPNLLYTEQSALGTDGYSITIRSNKPMKSKDIIYFCVEYIQYGLNATCQEELDDYKKIPDLKNTMRNRLIKDRNVECIYASPSYSSSYAINVIFPSKYPWRLLESADDMAIITLSSKQVDKSTMKKIANISVDENEIKLSYRHNFRSAHGHYILWRLPKREELNRYAIGDV